MFILEKEPCECGRWKQSNHRLAVYGANTHDSHEFTEYLDGIDETIYVDSAYVGHEVTKKNQAEICEKGYLNHPLTEEQKANKREESKFHSRAEHAFRYITRSMCGIGCSANFV